MFEYLKDNIRKVEDQITVAAKKSGRKRKDITLVAVAKTFGNDITRAAVEAGLTDIGESRIQDADPKIKALGDICRWHMIGHLQTNKAAKAIDIFDLIQSVDTLKLAEMINKKAENKMTRVKVLIEINSSGEMQKHGFIPEAAIDMIEQINSMPTIEVCGLMTIGPNTRDKGEIRRAFSLTRSLFESGRKYVGEGFDILSMGMSSDFDIAIEEGSNMVRIGTAIFGKRKNR